MQTISSQDQLNRIENRLQRVAELLELLLGKIAQEDESIFYKLVRSDRFQRELKEGLETLKKDPAQFTVVSLNCRDEVLRAAYHPIRASQGTKVP